MSTDQRTKTWGIPGSLLPCGALLLAAVIIYGKSVGFDFIPSWDDEMYVLNNLRVQSLNLRNLKAIFTEPFFSNYAPLHLLSYSIDYLFWGLNPAGYHLTNLIFHSLNVLAAFFVVKRITGKKDVAFVAALLFTLHPLNVENVAWVSERKTLLSAFFAFLSLTSYLNFREKEGKTYYILSAVFFIFAVLSKSSAVTLPLALMAYELFVNKERKWTYPLPFLVISALGILTVFAHLSSNSIEQGSYTFDSLFRTVYPTMAPVYWKYIGKILWPVDLSGFYDTPYYNSFLNPTVFISLSGWVILSIIALWKGSVQVRFWYLWFWIWFLPVSNIIPIPVFYADRYMYMPAIGAFVLFGQLINKISGELVLRAKGLTIERVFGYAAIFAVAVFYGVTAFNRLDVWHDELVFWEDTAAKSPNQYKARLNLGYVYEIRGRYIEAEREYMAAVKIYPGEGALENLKMVRIKKALKYGQ